MLRVKENLKFFFDSLVNAWFCVWYLGKTGIAYTCSITPEFVFLL